MARSAEPATSGDRLPTDHFHVAGREHGERLQHVISGRTAKGWLGPSTTATTLAEVLLDHVRAAGGPAAVPDGLAHSVEVGMHPGIGGDPGDRGA